MKGQHYYTARTFDGAAGFYHMMIRPDGSLSTEGFVPKADGEAYLKESGAVEVSAERYDAIREEALQQTYKKGVK